MPEPIRYEFIADTSKYDSNLKESDKWTLALDGSVERLGKTMNATFSNSGLKNATQSYTVSLKSLNSELKKHITTAQSATLQNEALLKLRDRLAPSIKSERIAIEKINAKLSKNEALITRVSGAKNTATAANNKYNQSLTTQSALLTQMQGQLANLFGIYAAQRFLKQMVKVRGEFELQSVALTAMLQDRKLADEMFAEVQALALKSPFKILELNSYLKQLKAYRIENEDLVGTLKQLGDISAGLGVDMSRLILAYGQVKAASVLRGQELRQFTEAGIPLVAQLADKFTELEGVVVSTADVFDRISKRQVSFEMIRDIFGEMTSEGGIFFNQQELQAGTLSGQVSVLADAWSKMLNQLGKANEGSLKGAIGVARELVDNYEIVLDVLKALVATYGIYKTAIIATNIVKGTENNLVALSTKLYTRLATAIKANPYVALATAITAVIGVLAVYYRQQRRINQEEILSSKIRGEVTERLLDEKTNLELLNRAYKNSIGNAEKRRDILDQINREYPDLLKNMKQEDITLSSLKSSTEDYIKLLEDRIRLGVLEDKISQNRAERVRATTELEVGEIDFAQYNEVFKRTEAQNKLLLIQIDYQRDLIDYGKEYADLRKEQSELAIAEDIKELADLVKQEIPLAIEEWRKLRDIQLEAGKPIDLNETYEDYLRGFNKFVKEAEVTSNRLAEIEARIKEILEGKGIDIELLKWQDRVNEILEANKELSNINIFEVDARSQDGLEYIKNLVEEYGNVITKLNLLKTVRDRDVSEERTALEQRKKLLTELAGVFPVDLDALQGGGKTSRTSILKYQKDQLKYLDEVRKFYEKLKGITKDTSFGGEELLKLDVENIFGDKKGYEDAVKNFTDDTYRIALENLIKYAEKLKPSLNAAGKASVDAFIAGIRDKLTDIEEVEFIDQRKLDVEIEKLRNKLLGSASPFGEGIVFDISLITTKAENDVRKIAKEYDKAMKGANEQQKQALTELRDREIKGIREVSDERISSLVEGSVKKELGVLEQFYSNINEATLSQIKQVDDAIQKLAETPLDPIKLISPEELETLNKAGVELEVIFEDIRSGVPDEELKEIFGLTEDQLKVLKKVDATTQKWNSTMESVVTKWNDLEAEEKLQRIGEAISEIGDAATQLGSAISAMDDELGSVLSGLGQAASIIGNITVGVATGNPAAVAAGVIQGITAIISATAREAEAWKAAQEELRRQLAASRRDFNLYVNEVIRGTRYISNSLGQLEETQSIFDVENPYSEAIAGVNALNDATKLLTGSTNEWSVSVSTAMGDIDVATFTTSLEDALNVLGRVQTGNEKYGGFLGIGEKTRATYSSLAEVLGVDQIDIFSKEQLNEAIANYDLLDEKTKELVDDWKEYASAADEALEQTNQNLRDLTSGVVTDFSTALIDGFVNATDAAEGLKGSVEDIIEAMLQQMLVSTLLAPVFDDLQRRFRSSLGLNPDGSIPDNFAGFQNAPDLAKDVGEWWEDLGVNDLIENSYDWLSDVQNQFKEFNLDIFQPDAADDSGLARGIQSITEDTANIIAAYLNTIRHQVILNTGYMEQMVAAMQASQGIASAQLAQLSIISSNTGRVADLLEAVASGNRTLKVA